MHDVKTWYSPQQTNDLITLQELSTLDVIRMPKSFVVLLEVR